MRCLIKKVVDWVVVKKFDTYEECEKFVQTHDNMQLDSEDEKFIAVMKVERTIRY